MNGALEATISVEVVYALPGRHWSVPLTLPAGATVAEALARARMPEQVPGLDEATLALAVYGRRVERETVLADGDRLELLRPLKIDPMQARRRRAAR